MTQTIDGGPDNCLSLVAHSAYNIVLLARSSNHV